MMKKNKCCKVCKLVGDQILFQKRSNLCISCFREDKRKKDKIYYENNKDKAKEYRLKNKEKISARNKKHRDENKEYHAERWKTYYENNKDELNAYNKKYYELHKDELSIKYKEYCKEHENEIYERDKAYVNDNRDEINRKAKIYRENNKDNLSDKRRINLNNKLKNDPLFKIRKNMSAAIRIGLKRQNINKDSSFSKYLNYSLIELFEYINKQFNNPDNTVNGVAWMTWDNWGVYDPKTWDDNDPSTWKWQLDHIEPQSDFDFSIKEEIEKCWAISNLRPYSAKQNFLDGVRLTRHKKGKKRRCKKE